MICELVSMAGKCDTPPGLMSIFLIIAAIIGLVSGFCRD